MPSGRSLLVLLDEIGQVALACAQGDSVDDSGR